MKPAKASGRFFKFCAAVVVSFGIARIAVKIFEFVASGSFKSPITVSSWATPSAAADPLTKFPVALIIASCV